MGYTNSKGRLRERIQALKHEQEMERIDRMVIHHKALTSEVMKARQFAEALGHDLSEGTYREIPIANSRPEYLVMTCKTCGAEVRIQLRCDCTPEAGDGLGLQWPCIPLIYSEV